MVFERKKNVTPPSTSTNTPVNSEVDVEVPAALSLFPGNMEVVIETSGNPISTRRNLSIVQLILINACVCGLEFCASAAFTYIPPMLLKAGIEEQHMTFVLGIGPFLGFIFVPIIGKSSDSCRSRYGRRRPFILGLGLLLIFALFVIPYGPQFSVLVLGPGPAAKAFAVWLLIIGAVLLDFTSQVALTPCEALLSDACRNTNQEERGFMVYSFMVSVGGCIGYLITALDWEHNVLGIYFGGQEKTAFLVLIILFTVTFLATLTIAQESPLNRNIPTAPSIEQFDIERKLDQIHQHIVKHKESNGGLLPPLDPGYESDSNISISENTSQGSSPSNDPLMPPTIDEPTSNLKTSASSSLLEDPVINRICPILVPNKTCNIPLTRWSVTNFQSCIYLFLMKVYRMLPNNLIVLFEIPMVLKRLALANFFSWTAVMSFNLFYTDFVAQAIYGGNPNAPEDSPLRILYDEGVRQGSWGLLYHCIVSAIYAAFIERLTIKYGMRFTYFIGMFSFTLSMAFMVMVKNIWLVNILAACTGLGFATLTTIPFMLVNTYHANTDIYYFDQKPGVHLGIGSDISALDSAYFLSQVMLSLVMGNMVHFTGTVVSYVVIAGAMGAVSCGCVMRIIISKKQLRDELC